MKNRFAVLIFLLWLSSGAAANCSSGGRDSSLRRYDICFKRDEPGANNRYVEYTPVKCSDESVRLGEAIGGELAGIEFVDTDADGVSEIIVSSGSACRWSFEPCLNPTRTVVKVEPKNPPVFTIISQENLEPSPEFKQQEIDEAAKGELPPHPILRRKGCGAPNVTCKRVFK
ncbi:MAG TPA: hypothetical protein VF721_09330 [Pyrinomonadaceae bacterium]|jgi:hypothetical protein